MSILNIKIPLTSRLSIPFPVFLWFLLATLAVVLELSRHSINNYHIFKYVFIHTLEQKNLYVAYPQVYNDTNHYGPLFGIVIAPFAMLPDSMGVILWALVNAAILFYAIRRLKFPRKYFLTILLIGAIELMSSIHHVQFNPMVASWIILSFVFVEEEKDIWASFFIVAGFLCKLYGIAGITFFLFSKHKGKFTIWFLIWMLVLFCLPMLFSSPGFITQSYLDWMYSLQEKDSQNALQSVTFGQQDISVTGIIRRISQCRSISDGFILVPAMILYCIPLLDVSKYGDNGFKLRYLALALISIVIFSSSAESVTYIIAITGVLIWFVIQYPVERWMIALMVFVFIVSIISPTDLCPPPLNHFIRSYALKALPCFIVWLRLLYEVQFKYTLQIAAL
ncbi:glycosyltransferase family 87 protein [Chitinophaga sancti]|uniref:Glycosyltransferase family 87 protein n=2 Tax=Chitinophaga sancti TaxID=1004 RepID=A0A1K1RRS3_9BACT|nr:glycosyltransferase family 87 protein [Chitinophaga sancti]WQG91959.1 glycosyltransferase family 87 protein [Chitinophaga sancti]SFW74447.1 Protein of unknown function [Chitinophaga sancti]